MKTSIHFFFCQHESHEQELSICPVSFLWCKTYTQWFFFQCLMLTTSLLNWPFSIRYSGWLKLSFVIFSTSSWEHIIPGLCQFEHIHPLILHLSGHKTLRSHSSPWRILGDPALLDFCCTEVFWSVFPLYVLGIMLRCESPLGLVKMQILTPEAGAEVPHLYGAGLWKLSV